MFTIKHDSASNHLEIKNSDQNVYVKIFLDDGASLQELILNNHHIIKDLSPLTYNTTYASSILFPFANRIKDGKYEFEGNVYQLDINESANNNALHGLVYNKSFELVKENINDTYASVKLEYHEKNRPNGFPFTYSIYAEYMLTNNELFFNLEVKNTDSKVFPFTLGWHPYFLSENLFNSALVFDSNLKLKLDNRNITQKIEANTFAAGFKVGNQSLDDCFVLDSNKVLFITPDYMLQLKSTEKDSYLQLFTPPHDNTIAIEPTTGVSDSFNNKIGLKTLKPNEVYKIGWTIEIRNS